MRIRLSRVKQSNRPMRGLQGLTGGLVCFAAHDIMQNVFNKLLFSHGGDLVSTG